MIDPTRNISRTSSSNSSERINELESYSSFLELFKRAVVIDVLNDLSLEEIIALKLELSFKTLGFTLEGFPLWKSINYITDI